MAMTYIFLIHRSFRKSIFWFFSANTLKIFSIPTVLAVPFCIDGITKLFSLPCEIVDLNNNCKVSNCMKAKPPTRLFFIYLDKDNRIQKTKILKRKMNHRRFREFNAVERHWRNTKI